MKDKPMTIIEHLEELRWRIIYSAIAFLVATVVGFYYADPVLELIRRPAGDLNLAILAVGEGFFVRLKIALVVGLFLSLPVLLYETIAFVLPALERHERRYLFSLLPVSLVLFGVGVIFAYVSVLPFVMRFFLSFATDNLQPVISVSAYVSFVIGLLLPFGFVFQLPVAVMLLTKLGLISPQFLARQRKYAVLVIFIIAAVLTPPDVVSQIMLAVPLLGLYELSIIISRFSRPKPS